MRLRIFRRGSMSIGMHKNFDYDSFLRETQKCCEQVDPSWVIARDVDAATAFVQWCIDNGIEEPRVIIKSE